MRTPASSWLLAEERRVFAAQVAVVLVVITLLNAGFYYQRELIELDVKRNVQRVVRGWDGLAWYVWLFAAPVTLALIRRNPVVKGRYVKSLTRIILGSIAIYLLVSNTRYLFRLLPDLWLPEKMKRPFTWTNYAHTESVLLPIDFLTFCGFFAGSLAIDYYFKLRQRADEVLRLQLHAAHLQSELAQAQLATLRGQLHPHFLFNTFNAISTLVRQRKNEFAVEMIAQLSSLLRLAMENIDRPELSLERELDFVRCYLDVERVRFGEKLQASLDVEQSALIGIVPSLLLQPLVENAIKHGISRRLDPGRVLVTAHRRNDRLLLAVIDDGPGAEPEPTEAPTVSGIGLRNTRRRLDTAYGANYRLEIARRPEGGTAVRLDLPWKEHSIGPVPALA